MTLVARRLGVPTIYVPHAPAARNRVYGDLPFDVAALRGPAEIRYYTGIGARKSNLIEIGAPGLPVFEQSPICRGRTIIVAPSPWDQDTLKRFVEFVETAGLENLLFCPHPRTEVAKWRAIIPSRWRRSQYATSLDAVLSEGGVLVQSGSGAGLEALLAGVPVVDIRLNSAPPVYPYLTAPVSLVDSPKALAAAVSTALEDQSLRLSGREWGVEWCSRTGQAAADGLKACLQGASLGDSWALDGWPGLGQA